jgi:metallo-beta-lactamase family protein
MCDAGRIRHHLKRWLWNPAATVMLTGYQAEGTLGRLEQEGKREVRIQGETIRVEAHITEIRDFSGHADATELARWLAARGRVSGGVFLMHGEAPAMEALAIRLTEGGIAAADQVIMPVLDECWTLPQGGRPKRQVTQGRRVDPARSMRPDWHNQRAALMLAIETATENARDDAAREALLRKLRAVLEEE